MDRALILLFNHQLTPDQERDARENLGVMRVVEPPEALRELWSNVPPDLPELGPYLEPIKDWLTSHATHGDFVLIQGDFGATCLIVAFAFEKDLVPIYSTTHREATEGLQPDGSLKLTHRFSHKRFRQYGG